MPIKITIPITVTINNNNPKESLWVELTLRGYIERKNPAQRQYRSFMELECVDLVTFFLHILRVAFVLAGAKQWLEHFENGLKEIHLEIVDDSAQHLDSVAPVRQWFFLGFPQYNGDDFICQSEMIKCELKI